MLTDFIFVLRWWFSFLAIGIIFLPFTKLLFRNSKDSFYIFSKVIGIGVISYLLLVLGTFHILAFSLPSILFTLSFCLLVNAFIYRKYFRGNKKGFSIPKIYIFEELLFFLGICIWSYVRAHEPSIHGLEKFMDYGFINSILRTKYFPPLDIWFTPFSINYYFFGHLVTAVLTKLSGIPANITYNLMLATLFSFTFTGAFSLLYNFLSDKKQQFSIIGGILGGTLLSLAGNLHIIYAFFAQYNGEHPVPPWALAFMPQLFPNNYWYPNATRFIPFTIHEFPLYSFVVSDLHGHVTDIPFVLLSIALLYTILKNKQLTKLNSIFISLLLAIMYMTNVWDGIIYLLLTFFVLFMINLDTLQVKLKKSKGYFITRIKSIDGVKKFIEEMVFQGGLIVVLYAIFTLPFNIHFKPFVSGIGILCAPTFLTNIGRIGPFLFEANHCQKSAPHQLAILYGFFYFFVFCFLIFIIISFLKKGKKISNPPQIEFKFTLPKNTMHIFILLLITLATLLIIIPEFLYAKDIYPQHYRANTMFKLVYQSFILLTLSSVYIIIEILTVAKKHILKKVFLLCTIILLILVLLYPYFAVKSYYNDLKSYSGLDGTAYLKNLYPGDLEAITFLNKYVPGQPIILEAQGDSYTDYARISSNTGLPTVLGWTVHEWLWRGTYDIPAPRITEVKTMYEGDTSVAIPLLKKYNVAYVIIGSLEHQKYPQLNEDKFNSLGKVIFKSSDGLTEIFSLRN